MSSRETPSAVEPLSSLWRFADVEVDEGLRELRVAGAPVEIEPRPFDLLLLLMNRAGEVVTVEEIIATTWAGRVVNDASSTNVSNAISKLRKLIKDDAREIIRTITKAGYIFSAPVERQDKPRRAANTSLGLGDTVPGRPHWQLTEQLSSGGYGDVWIGTNGKTREQRVFKFCSDETRLSALKRESTLFRVLRETLGDQAPVPALLEWQFETAPYYTEAERWGQDLAAWAAERHGLGNIDLAARLEILALTAEVVTAVHSVGVLHKDLKPQNVLVRQVDGELKVRLCDFGTGLLLEDEKHAHLDITRMGFTKTVSAAGTPSYMAPELQTGGKPSVQSDVYSLGVLLYQLVVGEWRPPAFGWESDIADELLRQDIADAIHRDPSRRPSSALVLAQQLRSLDVRRAALERQRSEARITGELAESLKRAQARRPWVIAAGVVLVLAVVASSVLMVKAQRAAAVATENEAVAQSVADFLTQDIVRQASPDYGGKVDVTLKAALLNGVPKIGDRVGHSVPAVAELSHSLADALASLSAPADAAKLAHNAAALYEKLYGLSDRRTLSAAVDEFRYRVLTEPAEPLLRDFDVLESRIMLVLPDYDPIWLRAALVRSRLEAGLGRNAEAEDVVKAAIDNAEAHPNAQDAGLLDTARLEYVRTLTRNAKYDAARRLALSLQSSFDQTYGPMSRPALDLHTYLGRAFAAERGKEHDYPRSEAETQIAIDGLSQLYGPNSFEVAFAMMDLGDMYLSAHRFTDTERVERALLPLFAASTGTDSVWTWRTRLQLVQALLAQSHEDPARLPAAVKTSREILALARASLPKNGYLYRMAVIVCGASIVDDPRSTDAGAIVDEVGSFVSLLPAESPEASVLRGQHAYLLGIVAFRSADPSARKFLQQSVELLEPLAGPNSTEVLDAKKRLASLVSETKK